MDEKLIMALIVVAATFGVLVATLNQGPGTTEGPELKKFSSEAELMEYVQKNQEQPSYYGLYSDRRMLTKMNSISSTSAPSSTSLESAGGSSSFSTTNIQVQGVDEADIVKNDGKYIYTISGNRLVIAEAYPAEQARIVSETELNGTPTQIFLNKNRLVVFGNYYESYTYIKVFDITDREKPKESRNIVLSGNYYDSRMIGDYVYAVVNMPAYYYNKEPILLPFISENGKETRIQAEGIYYFDFPDYSYNFINILSVNSQNDDENYNSRTFLAGNTQNMYVSMDSIYVTYTRMNYIYTMDNIVDNVIMLTVPENVAQQINAIRKSNESNKMQQIEESLNNYMNSLSTEERDAFSKKAEQKMAEFEERMEKEMEKTTIHKIAIRDGKIDYKGQGSVPGTVLNQFSMDEHNGYFRIATTTGHVSRFRGNEPLSKNNIYVLDEKLKISGMVEDLAPGERIYSARFMGDRAYLVTFRKVDPLFVIDLKNPENPKVLGKLKIPGYSDYLHPYDETHIIGLGKEALDAEEPGAQFAWYQGIKLALFDVSNPENPREVAKYNIGDRGTDSEALYEHKAFLFDREKNLLVIPITLAEIDRAKYAEGEGKVPPDTYGEFVWQGAYVLSLDANGGFKLKGKITHVEDDSLEKSGYYYSSPYSVKRALYIDNTLYTVSDKLIKANDLGSMEETARIKLPYQESYNRYIE
ncbi:beta-propeller domain-containing protein [Candidatus Woesearchaeota archaeon]|nr:beta-propeller domain-containing protein [Candidatus Woesearchaeota archaeon]